jgi:putative acetyltransferase
MLPAVTIVQALTPQDIACARELFQQYAASLGYSLCFQDFEKELAGLPGDYAPPGGRLLLAFCARRAGGCAALRPLEDGFCEMKRLYVRPEFRGQGLGHELTRAIIAAARQLGYRAMRLDTLSSMQDAISLYRSLGFKDIPPYCHNPLPGAVYMELPLQAPRQNDASAAPAAQP